MARTRAPGIPIAPRSASASWAGVGNSATTLAVRRPCDAVTETLDEASGDRPCPGNGDLLADDRPDRELERVPRTGHAKARPRGDQRREERVAPRGARRSRRRRRRGRTSAAGGPRSPASPLPGRGSATSTASGPRRPPRSSRLTVDADRPPIPPAIDGLDAGDRPRREERHQRRHSNGGVAVRRNRVRSGPGGLRRSSVRHDSDNTTSSGYGRSAGSVSRPTWPAAGGGIGDPRFATFTPSACCQLTTHQIVARATVRRSLAARSRTVTDVRRRRSADRRRGGPCA